MNGPMWYGETNISHAMLTSGNCDLDRWLVQCAPPESEGPHEILRVRVMSSYLPGMVRFWVLARAKRFKPPHTVESVVANRLAMRLKRNPSGAKHG